MAYPDFQLPFFITCDASNSGLGVVLYQTQDGVDKVISYASRTLSEAEKNYHLHSGKLEFLALKWAITERFSDYLHYGPPFDADYLSRRSMDHLDVAELKRVCTEKIGKESKFCMV